MNAVILMSAEIEEFQQRTIRGILESGRHTIRGCLVDERPAGSALRRLVDNLRRGRGGYVLVMARDSRRRARRVSDTGTFMTGLGISVLGVADPYSDETLALIAGQAPDILILLGGFGILGTRLLEAAPCGVIGTHFGDMRCYRGQPPAVWELMHRETEVGLTVHRLNEQIDAGDPIVERRLEIRPADTVGSIQARMGETAPPMMLEALDRLDDPAFTLRPLETLGRLYTLPNLRRWLLLQLKIKLRRTPSPVVAVRRSRAFALVARLTRPVRNRFDLNYLYHLDLRGPVGDARADIPVEMTRATPAEVESAALLVAPELRAKFLGRLDDGMACFVAKVDGMVVAYNWTRYRSGEDEGDVIELGPGEIYTTDAYTAEGFRGLRIHQETLGHMLRVAKAEGYLDAYTMGSALKRGARKSMPRLGWRLAGRVLRLRLAGEHHRVVRLSGSARPLRSA